MPEMDQPNPAANVLFQLLPRITRLEVRDLPSLDVLRRQPRAGSDVLGWVWRAPVHGAQPAPDHSSDFEGLTVEMGLLVERDSSAADSRTSELRPLRATGATVV